MILQASWRLSKPILLTSDMNEYCTASVKNKKFISYGEPIVNSSDFGRDSNGILKSQSSLSLKCQESSREVEFCCFMSVQDIPNMTLMFIVILTVQV